MFLLLIGPIRRKYERGSRSEPAGSESGKPAAAGNAIGIELRALAAIRGSAQNVHSFGQMLLTCPPEISDAIARSDLHSLQSYIARQEQILLDRGEQLAAAQRQLKAFAIDFRHVRRSERERANEVAQAQEETAVRLLKASRFRDEETGAHIWRVGLYARLACQRLNGSGRYADRIFRASQLHDVGKIGVPDAILRKPGKLDESEWALMREHTRIGAQVLDGSNSPLLKTACRIAATHHEHYDGTGYPNRLAGEQIPIEGRIVKLADTYDALRMRRAYKPLLDHATAVAIILDGDDRSRPEHFDPQLLRLFETMHREFEEIFRNCGDDAAWEL